MQDIRVLVADDEIPARGELKYELRPFPASRSSENARTEKKSSTS